VNRRAFISLLGGAAAWPLAARAQQPAMQVVGILSPASQNEELLRGFRQGLKQAGFVEGENVSILYHFAENEIDRLPALADDLGSPTDRRYRLHRSPCGVRGEGGYRYDPYRFRFSGRPGQARSCRQPRPARWQPDRDQYSPD
jgi:hypothetical protein